MDNLDAGDIQMEAMTRKELDNRMYDRPYEATAVEPAVPLQHMTWQDYNASDSFDLICLARSPDYTPAELDELFDEIRAGFCQGRSKTDPRLAG